MSCKDIRYKKPNQYTQNMGQHATHRTEQVIKIDKHTHLTDMSVTTLMFTPESDMMPKMGAGRRQRSGIANSMNLRCMQANQQHAKAAWAVARPFIIWR